MIIEYLEQLRKRPPAARQRFALIFAGSITSIVALIWGATIPARYSSLNLSVGELPGLETPEGPQAAAQGFQQFINAQEAWNGNVPQGGPQEYVPKDATPTAAPAQRILIATSSAEMQ